MNMMKTSVVIQLKITLIGSRPPIWRRIVIPADFSFFALHVAIQDAFGWQDSHLHQFFTSSPFKRSSQYQRISFPAFLLESPLTDEKLLDERKENLANWFTKPGTSLWYEYDFGDSWMHECKTEKLIPAEKNTHYPLLLDGRRACPPEDCGGIVGYGGLLKILANPKHPDCKYMLEWLGIEDASQFDPDAFDATTIRFQDPRERLIEYEDMDF